MLRMCIIWRYLFLAARMRKIAKICLIVRSLRQCFRIKSPVKNLGIVSSNLFIIGTRAAFVKKKNVFCERQPGTEHNFRVSRSDRIEHGIIRSPHFVMLPDVQVLIAVSCFSRIDPLQLSLFSCKSLKIKNQISKNKRSCQKLQTILNRCSG